MGLFSEFPFIKSSKKFWVMGRMRIGLSKTTKTTGLAYSMFGSFPTTECVP
jgi:hypothetical protein